jgi:hypothetical protein
VLSPRFWSNDLATPEGAQRSRFYQMVRLFVRMRGRSLLMSTLATLRGLRNSRPVRRLSPLSMWFGVLIDTFCADDPADWPLLELATPEYFGMIREEMAVEKFLLQGGLRLAGILNWLFAIRETAQ